MKNKNHDLTNYIKYCLGFIRLASWRLFRVSRAKEVIFDEEFFDLEEFLTEGDLDKKFLVNLETFYSTTPKAVTEENRQQYEKEKILAKKVEDLADTYHNNEFTKQLNLNFGYFHLELPKITDEELTNGETEEAETEERDFPLFSIPVEIDKDRSRGRDKYFIRVIEGEIQFNGKILQEYMDENLYYQLADEVSKFEVGDQLKLPVQIENLKELWQTTRDKLKLTDLSFDENSFQLFKTSLNIVGKTNYFLTEDLKELSKLKEEILMKSSLSALVEDESIKVNGDLTNERELYFPFQYNKYQRGVLKYLDNKAFIVEGPPGTGKSQTIANLVCHLAAQNKKVLFVSQKAQALKVVKDMLRELGIKYLFGYLPNPRSQQISEEDERDGIAPQLAGASQFLQRLSKSNSSNLGEAQDNLDKLKEIFNQSIHNQRVHYKLYNDLKKLDYLESLPVNVVDLAGVFSGEIYQEVKDKIKKTATLKSEIEDYQESSKQKIQEFSNLFSTLPFEEEFYVDELNHWQKEIKAHYYEDRSKLKRLFNQKKLNKNLNAVNKSLPREIKEYLNHLVKQGYSKHHLLDLISSTHKFSVYKEKVKLLENLSSELEDLLGRIKMSQVEFEKLDKIVSDKGIKTFKKNLDKSAELYHSLTEISLDDSNEQREKLTSSYTERGERVINYVQNLISSRLKNLYTEMTFRRVVAVLARKFQKSKRAFKTFDELKKDKQEYFEDILKLVPVWIMELDDASRVIPFKASMFDYVIFDESSQCNMAYALPSMFRAKQAIYFGDSEQMRDDMVRFKSNKSFEELARKFQVDESLQIKSKQDTVKSVMDISRLRGYAETVLRYHYRSPKELIGFSNENFYRPKNKELIVYNHNYLQYKDTQRIMLVHKIEVDMTKEESDKTNISEAEKIMELIKELRADPVYKDKSIGVLSFFNEQASLIRRYLDDNKLLDDNTTVSIIEGIQGDEKDIVIYSFVIKSPDDKRRYIPLTGEGGEINKALAEGRINVAFSRARLQTHCFVSLEIKDVPEGIWIKKYLRYVEDNGKVDDSLELKEFDSGFEKEFYHFVKTKLGKDYLIMNQVESCGFRIDFVVVNSKNQKRLAIECDGPTHFEDEYAEYHDEYIKSDIERQQILESAGWEFYRVKYSDWVNDKFKRELIISDIENYLK